MSEELAEAIEEVKYVKSTGVKITRFEIGKVLSWFDINSGENMKTVISELNKAGIKVL